MQLRTEANPALTAAQTVEHREVVLDGNRAPADTRTSPVGGLYFGQRDDVSGRDSSRQTPRRAIPARSVPSASGDAVLNKPVLESLKAVAVAQPVEEVRAAPIEVWEGEVKSIDVAAQTMHVYLRSKLGHSPDHAGEIAMEWVASQDSDLVRPGAVFYWTLYKETRRGSIKNSQELRFRRLPNWSRAQLRRIRTESTKLFPSPGQARVLED